MSTPAVICFFFTSSHKKYAELIESTCKEDNIEFYSEEISQELMDIAFKNKSKIWGNKFTGVDIKVKFVLKMIEKFDGRDILYLDCTSFIRNIPKYTQTKDMIFPRETVDESCRLHFGVNIGVIGLKCNAKTHMFWSSVDKLIQKGGWDQGITNILLGNEKSIGMVYKDSFSKNEQRNILTEKEQFPTWGFFDKNQVIKANSSSLLNIDTNIYKLTGSTKNKDVLFGKLCNLYGK